MQRPILFSLLFILSLCTCGRAPKTATSGNLLPYPSNQQERLRPGAIAFERLLCNYAENPMVIDGLKPRFSWVVSAGGTNRYQSAYRLLVSSAPELLAKDVGDVWDSGKLAAASSVHNEFGGESLEAGKTYYWKVRIWDEAALASSWSPVQTFTTGLQGEEAWTGARWITVPADERTSEHRFRNVQTGKMEKPISATSFPAGYFRREFITGKKVTDATVYVTGLGYYEVYLNGKKVGDHKLDPAPSNYDKTAYYVVLNAREHILEDANTLGIKLGNGFYGQNLAFKRDPESEKNLAYGPPAVRLMLKIRYEDGTSEAIVTDGSWTSVPGPIVFDNIYGGETYDARFSNKGWNENGYDDSRNRKVTVTSPVVGTLKPQVIPPIRKLKALEPQKIFRATNGNWIIDFGQNIAGWIRLSVREKAGTRVHLQLAEALKRNEDALFLGSTGGGASGLSQQLVYVCGSDARESWEPSFTYHGFRYAEVEGLSQRPRKEDFTAYLVSTDVEETGDFQCSDSLLNRMLEVSKWTVVDNLHGIPEDCPHREKCGWLGDAHAAAEFTLYNYDVASFYEKYMEDIRTQFRRVKGAKEEKDFLVPTMIAPGRRTSTIAKLDWGVAAIYLPWYHYLHYGNEQIVLDNYADMKQLTAYYLSFKNADGIIENGMGDWCPPRWDRRKNPSAMECHPVVSATAYFYDILKVMKTFSVLVEDEQYTRFLTNEISDLRAAFNRVYQEPIPGTNHRWYGSQTATVMAMQFDLVPGEEEQSVLNGLIYDIEEVNNGHHTVGIHGNRYLYTVLSDYEKADLAYSVLTNPEFPSQAFILNTGFTTWPERQFDWSTGIEFSNSLNHPMHSGFAAYFYERLGGIKPVIKGPGYKEFILDPLVPEAIDHADTRISSPFGVIENKWKKQGELFSMQLTIPFNTTAILPLSAARAGTVKMNGESWSGNAVPGASQTPITLGSGTYTVSYELE
ncbi:Bacterial alpha-L-rhamnosidase [Neolewinella aurantiaca]|uniref:alpha-L-rhamnosidase n=1 Tax=Neolewinella aurantiaca TaxID=2602767 RepID=A0A5C7FQV4_9BACT|nr:family 78 glycoside hydrolase catalytic domain [Neolewinella aurantiaca]TXF90240.1 Bacterial alpha-L-rhamnosidase [Neolewinella aurantiaca]